MTTGVNTAGEGDSISTYKDVLNLASEVGDPSLVYKFMSLAKSSALWSSRKGIAFGLGTILDKSKLDSLLSSNKKVAGRLIPKLFRYRFDPSSTVSRTMNDIWSALISNPTKTVVDNFDIILKELLANMGNREWRVRQASTAAVQDLLRYVKLERYEEQLEEIWKMAFRAMDDIKESVRNEGGLLTRYLASTMVTKISNSNMIDDDKKSQGILKQLIPFLLGYNGLLSESDDIKNFAFETILKLCNTSSTALKPFVSDMVEQMIIMMSSIEPQVINYLTLNADKYNLKASDIDSQRLNIVGNSPMMEAIEKLMNLLNESLMPDFLIHLSNAVKKSVGLPSKVTGSRVLVNLITRHIFLANNHGDELLKIASGQLKDRNETISKSYAIAIGYIARVASVKKLSSLSRKLHKYYFETEGSSSGRQRIAATTSEAISKYSPDKFQSVASMFLPLAFIGKHDTIRDKETAKLFNEEWSDSTPNSSTGIKLYFSEIVSLIEQHIKTPNFHLRQVLGLSVIEIVDKLGSSELSSGSIAKINYWILWLC
ncbi:unnamed protein product [Ambrosiozyma monospora]|uniref:Unnamed protein product n=1 Tax=Ambrosiozyma monospora TaxID=43982 RepID=A0ACB5TDI1_AMBMO|nr:unnamed protein product [Ambrosiozyma monospora]